MNLFAQTAEQNGLTASEIGSTIVYTILGIVLMVGAIAVINMVFDLKMRRELVDENNVAYGLMIGGMAVAIAIIIAGTVLS